MGGFPVKKVCIFVGSRANYSSIKSVMRAIDNHPKLKLQLLLGSSAILDRFGSIKNQIINDGFKIDYTFNNIIEGESPVTMAESTGLALIQIAMLLDKLSPDLLVVVGDRYEVMAATVAAAYMNIRIAHTMGGEVTGTIDESIRHAITKFAHIHFPANEDAKNRIIKLGENPEYVHNVGCPRIDLVREQLEFDSLQILKGLFDDYSGVGEPFDLNETFLLVSQHPVTTEFGSNRHQIEQTLDALNLLKIKTIMLWPNSDAGSDDISKGIRTFRERNNPKWLYLFKNLPTNIYIHLMNTTSCLVGNSSSGVREGSFIGTPVVNIGTRQNKRTQGKNVIDVGYSSNEIMNGIKDRLDCDIFKSEYIYGDGYAGEKIANIINYSNPPIQKTITF